MAETLRYPPLPPGTPHLMPFEEEPFNGDTNVEAEVLRLKAKHDLKAAAETGTCYGSTTLWLADNFEEVSSCEINRQYMDIARARLAGLMGKVKLRQGKSVEFIHDAILWHGSLRLFIFLDAHWGQSCPLLDELIAIANSGIHPCILIHDFQAPGTDFGFDSMPDGRPFDLDLVRPYLGRIYGEGKWTHNYPTEVAGARRGWISIEPV